VTSDRGHGAAIPFGSATRLPIESAARCFAIGSDSSRRASCWSCAGVQPLAGGTTTPSGQPCNRTSTHWAPTSQRGTAGRGRSRSAQMSFTVPSACPVVLEESLGVGRDRRIVENHGAAVAGWDQVPGNPRPTLGRPPPCTQRRSDHSRENSQCSCAHKASGLIRSNTDATTACDTGSPDPPPLRRCRSPATARHPGCAPGDR
jgi:hypothetical protein